MRKLLLISALLTAFPAFAVEEPTTTPPADQGNIGHYSVGEESADAPAIPEGAAPNPYLMPDVSTEIQHNIPDDNAEQAPTQPGVLSPAPKTESPAKVVSPPPDASATPTPPTEDAKKTGGWELHKTATVQVLDKTKVRNINIRVEVGAESKTGSLGFKVMKCYSSADMYTPDNAALIQAFDITSSKKKTKIFDGWMFSSAPGLTTIEHPIYDLMLVSCSD